MTAANRATANAVARFLEDLHGFKLDDLVKLKRLLAAKAHTDTEFAIVHALMARISSLEGAPPEGSEDEQIENLMKEHFVERSVAANFLKRTGKRKAPDPEPAPSHEEQQRTRYGT